MSLFGSLWSGVKKIGSGIWNAFTGDGSSNAWSGLMGLGSSALNYASSSKGIKEQYKYNTALQKQAQQWSTGMASTAHQLEVNDMRKAGLNPILSATGGSGASAPGATGGSVGLPDYDLSSGISTALAYRENRSLLRQRNYQNDLINAQTGTEMERQNTQAEQTDLLHKQQSLIDTQMEDIRNQIENRNTSTAAMLGRYATMNRTDLMNAITNATVGSATAKYTNERSRGYSYSGPFGISYSGDSINKIFKDATSGAAPVVKKVAKNAVKGVQQTSKKVNSYKPKVKFNYTSPTKSFVKGVKKFTNMR